MLSSFCFNAIWSDCLWLNVSNMKIIFSIYAKNSKNYLYQSVKSSTAWTTVIWSPYIPFDSWDNPATGKVCFELNKTSRCGLEVWCCYCFDVIAERTDWNKIYMWSGEICVVDPKCLSNTK